MTWQLCNGSSEYIVDLWGGCDDDTSWQKAKRHFQCKGYTGKFLLIKTTGRAFKVYRVNIKQMERRG